MNFAPAPLEALVFVCTHQRQEGERVACANPGRAGEVLVEKLREIVRARGQETKIRICKSGCLDRCEEGPSVLIVTSQAVPQWVKKISKDSPLPRIIDACQKSLGG